MPAYDYYIQNAYFYAAAHNYSSYQDVLVQVRGLEQGWENYGYFKVILDGGWTTSNFDIYNSDSGYTDRATTSYYDEKGYGIDKETEYQLSVYFYPYGYSSSDRVLLPVNSKTSGIYVVIINQGGQPPSPEPQEPKFSVSIVDNNKIRIDLSNYQDVNNFVYQINGNLYNYNYPYYVSDSLSAGNYTVGAYYDSGYAFIYSVNGNRYQQVQIGSGPTPTYNWNYNNTISLSVSSSNLTNSANISYIGYDGVLITVSVNGNGRLDIYSSNSSGNDFEAYIRTVNNGYNSSTGQPNNFSPYTDQYSINNISVTFNPCNSVYYIWIKSRQSTYFGSFTLNVEFTPAAPSFSYSYTYTNSAVVFNVSYPSPNIYYYVYRVGTYSGGSNIYDSDSYYGHHENVTTKQVSGLTYSTTYYINVGYSTSQNGSVTWIGQQSFTTGAPVINNYIYIFNGSQWKKAVPYIFNGSQWKEAQAYIFNGSQWKKCGQ